MTGQWGRAREGWLRRHLREHGAAWSLLAALGIGAVIRVRLLSVPFERDEGEYAYAGQLILQGIVPYDLAYTMKLPGVSTIYAALMLIFGQTHEGIHLGLLLTNAATGVLVFAIGKRTVGTLAGVAGAAFFALTSTLPGVQGLWANAEHFVLPFALAGVWMFLRWLDDRRDRKLLAAGALLGIAILMKQHGAAFFVFVGSFLLWELFVARTGRWYSTLRPLGVLVVGTAAPIAIMALVVFAMGNFEKFLFWTTEYATLYSTGNTLERGWANFLRKGVPLFQQMSVIGLMAAVGPLCLDWSPARRFASARLCGLALFSFLAVCPGLFFRPHYFVLLLPAACLLAGASLDRCHRLLAEFSGSSLLRSLPALLAVAMSVVTLAANQDYLLHATPDQVLRSTYGINPFAESVEVGKWLRENTEEDDRIAVIGSEPQIYFYAQRKSATGYIYTYPLMEDHPRARAMQLEMAREIETAKPRYLVYVNNPSSWMTTKRSSTGIIDWFWNFQRQYQIVGWAEANPGHSTVNWGRPVGWPPQSSAWMAVYRRIGTGQPGPR